MYKICRNLLIDYSIPVPVKLVGNGSSETEGYVEAINITTGLWGGVCDNGFDMNDFNFKYVFLYTKERIANDSGLDKNGSFMIFNFQFT